MANTSNTMQNGSETFLRIVASLFGGYVFTWGISTLGIALLVGLGIGYETARSLLMIVAFLIFLAAFLWAFAAERLALVWLVLIGGGTAMSIAAWLVQAFILRGTA